MPSSSYNVLENYVLVSLIKFPFYIKRENGACIKSRPQKEQSVQKNCKCIENLFQTSVKETFLRPETNHWIENNLGAYSED